MKVESADADDQCKAHLAKQVADLQNNLLQQGREFQDMVLDMKLVQTKAKNPNGPFHAEFRSSLVGHVQKLGATKNVLERMHSEQFVASAVPKLLAQMEKMHTNHEKHEQFALRNGYKELQPKKRAKKQA